MTTYMYINMIVCWFY